jgi:hypothetical protein
MYCYYDYSVQIKRVDLRMRVWKSRAWKFVLDIFIRFRYPVSTPEEVAKDLGFAVSNSLTFQQFINSLLDPTLRPQKLTRFMPRQQAENMFHFALRREIFQQDTLFSYYFKSGWVEFNLHFDDQARLRRLYVRNKNLKQKQEIFISQ